MWQMLTFFEYLLGSLYTFREVFYSVVDLLSGGAVGFVMFGEDIERKFHKKIDIEVEKKGATAPISACRKAKFP